MMKKNILLLLSLLACCILNAQDSLLYKKVEALEKTTQSVDWNTILSTAALSAILFGLIGYFFKKSVDTKVASSAQNLQNDFENRVIRVINEKEDLINRTFENVDLERRLVENKRIYLYGEDTPVVKRVLKNMGFNISQNLLTKEEELKDGYDILFINNEKGSVNIDEVVKMVNELSARRIAFYYNTTKTFFPTKLLETGKEDKVNFVTNASQIYGNLLNTLKYQDKL